MPYITTAERIGIQKGKKEGRKEGKKEGRKEGKKEGRKEGIQLDILDILEVRFGKVDETIANTLNKVCDLDCLRKLHRQAVVIASLDEFIKLL